LLQGNIIKEQFTTKGQLQKSKHRPKTCIILP
jgi:hypothetical protein